MVLAGVAGLVAGALSMAVGEFISVSSQVRGTACVTCAYLWPISTSPPLHIGLQHIRKS
jgi:hypothetical protein